MTIKNRLKKKLFPVMALSSLLAISACSVAEKNASETTPVQDTKEKPYKELKFNTLINPYKLNDHTTFLDLIFNPLFNELESRSNGTLRTKYYIADEFTPVPEIHDSVLSGKADMGFNVVLAHQVERYPVSSLFKVPRADQFTYQPSYMAWRMLNEFPEMQREWKDDKVLFMFVENNGGIATVSKPIHSIDDLKGLKIICQNEPWVTNQLKALGAEPVHIYSVEQIKTFLEDGTADGMAYDLPGFLVGYQVAPLLKYTVDLPLAANFLYTVMNKDVWNSLTDEQQAAVNAVFNEDAYTLSDKALVKMDSDYYQQLDEKYGVKRTLLSRKDKAKAAKLLQPVRDDYAKLLDSKGYDGKDLMQRFDRLMAEYAE